ncbi:MAG TPA: alpha-galactosidase [Candidatus Dormibacteraeota bacterium]|jgi:alpha-galactosidase|nr:alpha-galactosidase [Candidatus Dormibacteraeota bacterium]
MRIVYIGAGSAVFGRQLITDILEIEGLESGTIALCDLDAGRLDVARRIAERLVARSGKAFEVVASIDRTELLADSDIIINSIEVAGGPNVGPEHEIPLRYGVDQTVADTIGAGGIFKALRTGPAWLDIVRDVARLASGATILNYTNPMSILTLAAIRATGMPIVGLCHSVQGTSRRIAEYLEVPYEEMTWRCAGINHNAWFTELRRGEQDLYPRLRERAQLPEVYERDKVRFEVMLHLGYFVTESSRHFSEYVPYFRKRKDLIERFGMDGSGLARSWAERQAERQRRAEAWASGQEELPSGRSTEYGADIVEAIATGRPKVVHGNVVNEGLIDNLPQGGCVEVACLVDRRGVQPVHFGRLPEQMAALNRSHMAVHELMVQALLDHDRQAALHALMLDPLTAAVCSLDEIERLFEEMWIAEGDFLPDWK